MFLSMENLLNNIYENFGWGEKPVDRLKKSGTLKECSDSAAESFLDLNLLKCPSHPEPKITRSRKACTFVDFDNKEEIFDLLGEYRPIKKATLIEGEIILYEGCIKEFGIRFYKLIGKTILHLSRQNCIDMVREIVQYHELGHWITHWMPDKQGCRWNSEIFWENNTDAKELREGLAQIFTYYAMINTDKGEKHRSNLIFLFEFMLKGQAPCYHKHLDILCNKNFSWDGCFAALSAVRKEVNINSINLNFFLKKIA